MAVKPPHVFFLTNGAQTHADLSPNLTRTSALQALQQLSIVTENKMLFANVSYRQFFFSLVTPPVLSICRLLCFAALNIAPAPRLRNINTDVVQKRLNYSCSAHNRSCRSFSSFPPTRFFLTRPLRVFGQTRKEENPHSPHPPLPHRRRCDSASSLLVGIFPVRSRWKLPLLILQWKKHSRQQFSQQLLLHVRASEGRERRASEGNGDSPPTTTLALHPNEKTTSI